jgi:hypothetical protein
LRKFLTRRTLKIKKIALVLPRKQPITPCTSKSSERRKKKK